ncbi:hypothetical protein C2E23DRAFT_513446 [Lenzites betulinus]|nr:hypothetical protein C2E23DRAFT_513446 [Lenzites betulinus]
MADTRVRATLGVNARFRGVPLEEGEFSPAPGNVYVWFSIDCIANFFSNFVPNATVSVFSEEGGKSFTTRYRSTAFEIAVAGGKHGVIAGVAVQPDSPCTIRDCSSAQRTW